MTTQDEALQGLAAYLRAIATTELMHGSEAYECHMQWAREVEDIKQAMSEPQFVGCAYYESNGACCESGEPCKADVQNNAVAQPQAQEPVMIYHGRCTIDCGDHGHHDMEMLKLIPAGTKLYAHPAPKQAEPSWQPIESAPNDGRKIIVTYANRNGIKRTVMACWLTEEQAAETDGDGVGLDEGWYECIDNWSDYTEVAIHEGEPTHWLPLPTPPEAK